MPAVPEALDAFAGRETNRALLSRSSLAEAMLLLHEHDLPLHEDTPRNWDGLLAVVHAVRSTPRDSLVLDAGAEIRSAFLPALARLGYSRLLGVNLDFGAPMRRGPVEHRFGDVERLDLPAASVGFAAALSVVEHGVDLPRFFAEMARVLLPGAFLFVSTDYWGPGLDAASAEPGGAPLRPFDSADVAAAVEAARGCGLSPTGPVATEVSERVVQWRPTGLRYTFHNLLFQKPSR